MSKRMSDLTGQKFGKLTVIGLSEYRTSDRHTRWKCLCECGKETHTFGRALFYGQAKSCGCMRATRLGNLTRVHGEANKTVENRAWLSMRGRCLNPNNGKYAHYGARGIKICERWSQYENFLADMGRKPSPEHSLDRIDVNGDYEPSNCRWLGPKEQYWNRQASLKLVFFDIARRRLPKEVFAEIWEESVAIQKEKSGK